MLERYAKKHHRLPDINDKEESDSDSNRSSHRVRSVLYRLDVGNQQLVPVVGLPSRMRIKEVRKEQKI